jgi:hypothetical protein
MRPRSAGPAKGLKISLILEGLVTSSQLGPHQHTQRVKRQGHHFLSIASPY